MNSWALGKELRLATVLALIVGTSGCQAPAPGTTGVETRPVATLDHRVEVLRPAKLAEIDGAIQAAIQEGRCPGGVFWLEHAGQVYHRAYGNRSLVPVQEVMTEDTLFDAASLTKVLATTPAIMLLWEQQRLKLDAPVREYLPEFAGGGKESITVRHLMTHTSGLRPGIALGAEGASYAKAIELACAEKTVTPPGTAFRYSDINFIVLGELVQRISGERLDTFCTKHIYQPLGMKDTGFLPAESLKPRIAPTTVVDGKPTRGVVHDPTSSRMGGVAGHAGLFTTAQDLARFSRMMLREGELDGTRLLQSNTVRLMTSVQSPSGVEDRRGLGWDIDTAYCGQRGAVFPKGGYGHTGWTGGSLWIDPFSQSFVIFLSNRNHPDENGNVLPLRNRLGTLAAEAIADFNFVGVPGTLAPLPPKAVEEPQGPVRNGIDVLAKQGFAPLRGLRVGLITNHTGHDRERHSTIDLLKAAPEVKLVALFSPEHGIRGVVDEKVPDGVDEKTGLPVFSLYGESRQPQAAQLQGLDVLVFDIQDIGCRFYTYISTLGLAMEAAAKADLQFFVLDRVNPIASAGVDGPVTAKETSFTAFHSIPIQHGMTVGELAQLFNAERGWKCRLKVIPVQNWNREDWFDRTGLPWTHPSPNMRSLTEATLYPGVGLLETTALSVGRGTDTPFELVGAPYVDDVQLAAEMNRLGLTGVSFVPVRFTPKSSVYKGQPCGGVQILLLDREKCRALDIGIGLAATLTRLYPKEFVLEPFNRLLQHPDTLESIRGGKTIAQTRTIWEKELRAFERRRSKHLLY